MEGIAIKTALTQQDIKTASYYNIFVRGIVAIIISWLPFLGGLLAIIFYDFLRIPYLLCAAFMVYSIVMTLLQIRRAERLFRKRKDFIGVEHVVQVTDENIEMQAPEESLTFTWSDITNVRELSALFLFYTSARRLVYLPKRDMTENQIIELRGLVRNHLAFKYYKLKG